MEELKKKEQELRASIRDKHEQQRTLEKELRKSQKMHRSSEQRLREVALVLLVREAPEMDMAKSFLMRRGSLDAADALTTIHSLQDRILSLTVDAVARILDGGGVDKHVLKEAQQYEQEYQLQSWVKKQNQRKGVAPEMRLTLRHMRSNAEAFAALGMTPWPSKNYSSSRKWVQRFRSRWSMKLGRFPARESLSTDDMRQKAKRSQVEEKQERTKTQLGGAKSGKKGAHFLHPKSGSRERF